jgi:hypothetical protein
LGLQRRRATVDQVFPDAGTGRSRSEQQRLYKALE